MSTISLADAPARRTSGAATGDLTDLLPSMPAHARRPARGRIAQLLRYSAVSVIATVVTFTALCLLVATHTLSPGPANVVATGIGTIPSFELNRRWVWGRRDRRSVSAQILPFCVLSFAGLVLSTIAVSAAGRWTDSHGVAGAARTVVLLGANAITFGTLWIFQFALLDKVLFRHQES